MGFAHCLSKIQTYSHSQTPYSDSFIVVSLAIISLFLNRYYIYAHLLIYAIFCRGRDMNKTWENCRVNVTKEPMICTILYTNKDYRYSIFLELKLDANTL